MLHGTAIAALRFLAMENLERATTALVLIDLQQGIVSRETQPHPAAKVVTNAATLAARFRQAGAPVVLVHVRWAADYGDAPPANVDSAMPRPPGGFPAEFSELVPELGRQDSDIVILKRNWGAFYGTDLDLQLRRRGIRTIVLGGIATNLGVESTARDGWEHNYEIVFAEDAMASMSAEWHEFAVKNIFPRLGRVRQSGEIALG